MSTSSVPAAGPRSTAARDVDDLLLRAWQDDPTAVVLVALVDGRPVVRAANATALRLLAPGGAPLVGRPLGGDGSAASAVADLLRAGVVGAVPPVLSLPVDDGRAVDVEALASPAGDGTWSLRLGPVRHAALRDRAAVAEAGLEELVLRAPVGIALSEVGLRLDLVNETLARLLDLPDAAPRRGVAPEGGPEGPGWLDAVDRRSRPALVEALLRCLAGEDVDLVVDVRTDDGRRELHLQGVPVPAVGGAGRFLVVGTDVTADRLRERRLEHQARHDPLTGLPNRAVLRQRLEDVLEGEQASSTTVALLDLDGFKEVNDRRGHAAGDQVLQAVGAALRDTVREDDLVARLGGDEFVVLARTKGRAEDLQALARRLRAAVAGAAETAAPGCGVTGAVGLVVAEGRDPDELLRRADEAMYVAKRAGAGRVEIVPPRRDEDTTVPVPRQDLP